MKKLTLFIICFLVAASLSSFAQKTEEVTRKDQIGIIFSSFGSNDVIRNKDIIGGASYSGDKFYTLGINYIYKLNKNFNIETGIEYSNHKIIVHPEMFPYMENLSHGANLSLIDIPVTLRVNFLKYFFINGGLFLGIDMSNSSPIDSQNGIGENFGVGFKYDFKYSFTAFLNPYVKIHSSIPFLSADYPQKVMESGFRFGFMYNLK